MPAHKKTHCLNGHERSAENLDRFGVCRICSKEKKARTYLENREAMLERDRQKYRDNPEAKKNYARQYRLDNPEKAKLSAKKRRDRVKGSPVEKEKYQAWYSEYYKKHPEKRRIRNLNRRLRIRSNGGLLSKDVSARLLKSQKNKCYCCSAKLSLGYHLDHIVPIALGGLNVDSNIQLLCPACNIKKGAKHPADYALELGRLFL